MPLAGAGLKVGVEYEAKVDELIAASNRVLKDLDENKAAIKQTNRELEDSARKSEEAAKKNSFSWTEFRSAYSTVLDVVRVGQSVWNETGNKFIENAVAAGDMARSLGTTTEEASRLKEIGDDVGISITDLTTAFKLAQKDGVSPTIDGLAELSDEYLALQPGVERTQFLLDKFGRSGEDMGKLLEKGSASIREMSAAIDESLIVTQEGYEKARQYQISVDALSDSWDAFTYDVAPPLIDAMTKAVNMQRDLGEAQKAATESGKNWWLLTKDQQQAFLDLAASEREQADAALLAKETSEGAGNAFETEAEKTKRLNDEMKAVEEAIKAVSQANQDYINLVEDMQKGMDDYEQKHAAIQEQLNSGNITLDEAQAKWATLAEQQEEASRRMILSMLEQQLAIGGLNEAETNYLLNKGLEWGVYSQSAVEAAQAAQDEVRKLTDDFNAIPTEKTMTITVSTVNVGYTPPNATYQQSERGRDVGGSGDPGVAYRIGTGAQPEMFIPHAPGTFVPNVDKQQPQGFGTDPETKGLLRKIANQKPMNEDRLATILGNMMLQASGR